MHNDEDGANDRRSPDQLLAAVEKISDPVVRARSLAELVPRLPGSAYEQVIELAGSVPTQARLWVLARLAGLLQTELAERVLSAAGVLTDEYLSGDLIAAVDAVLEELFVSSALDQLFPRLPVTRRRDLAIRRDVGPRFSCAASRSADPRPATLLSARMTAMETQGYAVGWFALSLINACLAQSKNRSGLAWFAISLLLGPAATFLIVVLDRVPQAASPDN